MPILKDMAERPDMWSAVIPGSWLETLLRQVHDSKKIKWKRFYRMCAKIPTSSPVHNVTSFRKLNERRCQLIFDPQESKETEEFRILQNIVINRQTRISNFLRNRLIRRKIDRIPGMRKLRLLGKKWAKNHP